jgi:transcriptional regulator with XRE-family HTH domain
MYPNLKLAIFKKGLRQNQLAREVGIHEVILSKIIHGYREPSAEQRTRLSQYLDVNEGWLFEKYAVPVVDVQSGDGQERDYGES